MAADDYFDTALALNLANGTVRWSRRLQGIDTWTVACLSAPPGVNCPLPSSPDYDLGGSGPNLVGNIVGFGQKSGIYWALNPANGDIVWSTIVGPGSTLGGIEWGTATDGSRIYVAITNNNHVSYQLQPNGPTIDWGSWAALDVRDGHVVWQIADPTPGAQNGLGEHRERGCLRGIVYDRHSVWTTCVDRQRAVAIQQRRVGDR